MAESDNRCAPVTVLPRRVLAVEDDEGNRALLRAVLTSDGYAVDVAATGQDALALAGRRAPALAVIDLSLPDMAGVEVMDRLRADAPAIRILLVTGEVSPEARHAWQGADAYLLKPYDIDALLDAAQTLLACPPWSERPDEVGHAI